MAERDERAVTGWKEVTWAEVKESGRPAGATSASRTRQASPADRPEDAPGADGAALRSRPSAGAARGACPWRDRSRCGPARTPGCATACAPAPQARAGTGLGLSLTHDYLRNGLTTLFAAFDVGSGKVISSPHRRHRAQEFEKFLVKIDREVPEGLDIHLICDNYGTHKTPAIRAWLERHPRFHLHFTPTGSSWINQVEPWFGFPGDQMIRRGAHRSVQALEADIRAWTKSAEEILEFPARFCQRISGAGH